MGKEPLLELWVLLLFIRYSFVNTASQLKSMLGEAFGKKVTKLPQIPPYRQRGATMV